MARIANILFCLTCLATIWPTVANSSSKVQNHRARILSPSHIRTPAADKVSFKVHPAMQAIEAESTTSAFMPGLPSTHKTIATPRASVKFQTVLHGTKKLRNLLKINGQDSTRIFIRFDLDKFGTDAPNTKKRLFGDTSSKERLHYGPSFGFQVTVSPKLNVEAEYTPQFGTSPREGSAPISKFNIKDGLSRVERVDEFRLRINLNFGANK